MFHFTDDLFKVIEARLGPRLGKIVATTLLITVVLAIFVVCVGLIWNGVAPLVRFVFSAIQPHLGGPDWVSALVSALLVALVWMILTNVWARQIRRFVSALWQNVKEVQAALDQAHTDAQKVLADTQQIISDAHNKSKEILDGTLASSKKVLDDAQASLDLQHDEAEAFTNTQYSEAKAFMQEQHDEAEALMQEQRDWARKFMTDEVGPVAKAIDSMEGRLREVEAKLRGIQPPGAAVDVKPVSETGQPDGV
jgi:hypothetical protein